MATTKKTDNKKTDTKKPVRSAKEIKDKNGNVTAIVHKGKKYPVDPIWD